MDDSVLKSFSLLCLTFVTNIRLLQNLYSVNLVRVPGRSDNDTTSVLLPIKPPLIILSMDT